MNPDSEPVKPKYTVDPTSLIPNGGMYSANKDIATGKIETEKIAENFGHIDVVEEGQ